MKHAQIYNSTAATNCCIWAKPKESVCLILSLINETKEERNTINKNKRRRNTYTLCVGLSVLFFLFFVFFIFFFLFYFFVRKSSLLYLAGIYIHTHDEMFFFSFFQFLCIGLLLFNAVYIYNIFQFFLSFYFFWNGSVRFLMDSYVYICTFCCWLTEFILVFFLFYFFGVSFCSFFILPFAQFFNNNSLVFLIEKLVLCIQCRWKS